MAEYCDTLQSKEERNREYEACLSERAILRLLDRFAGENGGVFGGVCARLGARWLAGVGVVQDLLINVCSAKHTSKWDLYRIKQYRPRTNAKP